MKKLAFSKGMPVKLRKIEEMIYSYTFKERTVQDYAWRRQSYVVWNFPNAGKTITVKLLMGQKVDEKLKIL